MKDALGHGSDPRGAHSAGVDQVGKPVWYHGSPKAAQIQKQGFNLNNISKNSGSRGITGTGVYMTTNKDHAALYGSTVGVEPVAGLKMFSPKDFIGDLFNPKTNYGDPDKITQVYQKEGYDGIVVSGRNGQKTAVVFNPANVKVKK